MQNEQRSSQPFMVVTNALTGASPGRGLAARKRGDSRSKTVRARGGSPPRWATTRAGISARLSGPTTRSTCGMRCRSFSPSCCATQPAMQMTRSGRARFRRASLPASLRSFCSAFSRTLHVLRMTRSASSTFAPARHPWAASTSTIRSESWTFIWHPNVCTKYRPASACGGAASRSEGRGTSAILAALRVLLAIELVDQPEHVVPVLLERNLVTEDAEDHSIRTDHVGHALCDPDERPPHVVRRTDRSVFIADHGERGLKRLGEGALGRVIVGAHAYERCAGEPELVVVVLELGGLARTPGGKRLRKEVHDGAQPVLLGQLETQAAVRLRVNLWCDRSDGQQNAVSLSPLFRRRVRRAKSPHVRAVRTIRKRASPAACASSSRRLVASSVSPSSSATRSMAGRSATRSATMATSCENVRITPRSGAARSSGSGPRYTPPERRGS